MQYVSDGIQACNPLVIKDLKDKKKRADDFESISKKDHLDDDYESSAAAVSKLLGNFYDVELGTHIADSVTGVGSAVASSAFLATGAGAPVAFAVAMVGAAIKGIIALIKQSELDEAASSLLSQIIKTAGSYQNFIEESYNTQHNKTLKKILQEADYAFKNGYDKYTSLDSYRMTTSDLVLTAATGAGANLKSSTGFRSAQLDKNITTEKKIEDVLSTDWDKKVVTIDPKGGVIKLGPVFENNNSSPVNDSNADPDTDVKAKRNYITFSTHFDAAGTERFRKSPEGKNKFKTSLTIEDLKGWAIKGTTDDECFNIKNLVTLARSSISADPVNTYSNILAGGGMISLWWGLRLVLDSIRSC